MRAPLPRPDMRRAVVLLPNGFTMANLFFGIFAVVAATRGDYLWAGWCVVLGGVMDALDGQVARATRTGSAFGVELDSLVDGISFGVAPAFIMYFAVLSHEGWSWLFCFVFIACVVMRLARFNVEQGGRAKTHFHGLPSPAAGMTLATYYWFSQTDLYMNTFIATWPWRTLLPGVMLVLSFLMISHVLYPAMPRLGFDRLARALTTLGFLAVVAVVLYKPLEFAFPALVTYIGWGFLKTLFFGVVDRLPMRDPLLDEDEEELEAVRPVELGEVPAGERRRIRFGRRHGDALRSFKHQSESRE